MLVGRLCAATHKPLCSRRMREQHAEAPPPDHVASSKVVALVERYAARGVHR